MLKTSIDKIKENRFKLTKERSKSYPAQTITDTDDIAFLANTPTQTETLLHRLERATVGIGLHVNTHKMESMSFNQRGDISTLNGSSLKLVDKFNNLGSSVSSTKTDINTRLAGTACPAPRSTVSQSYSSLIKVQNTKYCWLHKLLFRKIEIGYSVDGEVLFDW